MRSNEFVKSVGLVEVKKYINNAHRKATHIYIGFMGTASYFYQHPSLNWCEVDNRTIGWDSDRFCYGVHPPISSMFSIEELKRLVKSHELVKSCGGLEEANRIICDAYKGSIYDIPKGHEELSLAIQDVESCM